MHQKRNRFHVYTKDFDGNGTEDIMLAKYYNDKQVPVRGKGCTAQQMPYLKERITSYNEFANRDIAGIIGDGFSESLHYEVVEFQSGIFLNEGNDGFVFSAFPIEAQTAPINSIVYNDFDGDAIKDLLMAGNNYQSEVETTRADAGTGIFLKGFSIGRFKYISNRTTGFFADKDVRGMAELKSAKGNKILVVNNNDFQQIFEISKD